MRLDLEDGLILGRIVCRSLAAALTGEKYVPALEEGARPALLEKRGCFVTLKKNGALRGCIGCFSSDAPLYHTAAIYARHSALDDYRFFNNRLGPDDLPDIEVEMSVLTPLTLCRYPERIILGDHGIHVSAGGRSGCFLPQVAIETGWTVEEFWGHCCQDKAGLPWDAWRRPETTLMTFTAEVFDCLAGAAKE
ncbi:MAG: AmmeMemoRadiSam system protein A [Planctomycetota bacterium]|jgi:AmmeMemoRadiSam system protein A|nr:AmmeMemoRadiSam system protein A [Planctomycetota bacterium]